jgi:hypothetical protein
MASHAAVLRLLRWLVGAGPSADPGCARLTVDAGQPSRSAMAATVAPVSHYLGEASSHRRRQTLASAIHCESVAQLAVVNRHRNTVLATWGGLSSHCA